MPKILKIDHIHIYTPDRLEAEKWYKTVLDFKRVEELEFWSKDGGPLTITNGDVHLALFESDAKKCTTVAFSVDSQNYEEWKVHLSKHNVAFTEEDHDLSWSIYFCDPSGNPYEITTYEYDQIHQKKSPVG